MKERDPGFLYGLNVFDILKIAGAFLFALAGFYLIWRTMFGPPLFEPTAIQAQLRRMQTKQQQEHRIDPPNRDTAGEVSVGIAPSSPQKNQ
ncbi:MAG TPA: hypothetical protein VHX92_00795 [Rhizomicrobium sp.]|jgi:hypothetical protein|nr:hypothetical protein [Rhizomicrobium sp.]